MDEPRGDIGGGGAPLLEAACGDVGGSGAPLEDDEKTSLEPFALPLESPFSTCSYKHGLTYSHSEVS